MYLINASIVYAFIIPTSIFLRTSLSSTFNNFIFYVSYYFFSNSSNSFWCLSFFFIDNLKGELIESEFLTWSKGIPRFSLYLSHFWNSISYFAAYNFGSIFLVSIWSYIEFLSFGALDKACFLYYCSYKNCSFNFFICYCFSSSFFYIYFNLKSLNYFSF